MGNLRKATHISNAIKMNFWTYHELERPWTKISSIWYITQTGNMPNKNTSTASLHSKQWFHEDQEAKFL